MILPSSRLHTWDLVLFRHQFCWYVKHLFKKEICRIRNGLTTVQVILSHGNCWFHWYNNEHSPNDGMFFSIFCTIGNFCFLRIWSLTRFTQDIDSTDNCNSGWSLASSWELISGRPGLSRSESSFVTDCVVQSKRISSWPCRTFRVIFQEVLSGRPDRSYVLISVFHSWEYQARSSFHFE